MLVGGLESLAAKRGVYCVGETFPVLDIVLAPVNRAAGRPSDVVYAGHASTAL